VRPASAIAAVVACVGFNAGAGEEMLDRSFYYCNAQAMNKAIVRLCSAKDPQLAPRGERALAAWTSRFGEKAVAAARKCESIEGKRPTRDELAKFQASRDALHAKWLADIEWRVKSYDKICDEALSHLEKGDRFEEGM
jgi:hypothetical protein